MKHVLSDKHVEKQNVDGRETNYTFPLKCYRNLLNKYQYAVKAARTKYLSDLISRTAHCPKVLFSTINTVLNPVIVMTGLRRVDSLAARCLMSRGRNKRAMVSRQKQEYQRQSRDVNNTRQGSRSQAQVQRSKVGQSRVKHRDGRKNNAQNVSQGKTRLRTV